MYSNKICLHAKGEALDILLFSWEFYRFEWGCHFFPLVHSLPLCAALLDRLQRGITGDFETTRPSEALLTWRTTTEVQRTQSEVWGSLDFFSLLGNVRGSFDFFSLLGNVRGSFGLLFSPGECYRFEWGYFFASRGSECTREKHNAPTRKDNARPGKKTPTARQTNLYSWISYMYSNKICLHAKGEALDILLFSWGILSFRVGMSFFSLVHSLPLCAALLDRLQRGDTVISKRYAHVKNHCALTPPARCTYVTLGTLLV